MMVGFLFRTQMGNIFSGICNHWHHPPENGTVCSEKIIKGKSYYQYQPCKKTTCQHNDLCIPDQLFIVGEFIGLPKIKYQEYDRNNCIVQTIFKEWIGSSSKKMKMATEKDKGADIPAHDEHANRHAYNGHTD